MYQPIQRHERAESFEPIILSLYFFLLRNIELITMYFGQALTLLDTVPFILVLFKYLAGRLTYRPNDKNELADVLDFYIRK